MATHSIILAGNLMDRGAWQATVHGVAESQTQWKLLTQRQPKRPLFSLRPIKVAWCYQLTP